MGHMTSIWLVPVMTTSTRKRFFAVLEKPVDYIVRKGDAEYDANVAALPASTGTTQTTMTEPGD